MGGAVVDLPLIVNSCLHLREVFVWDCRPGDPENVVPGVAFARNETEAVIEFAHKIAPSLSVMMGFPFK